MKPEYPPVWKCAVGRVNRKVDECFREDLWDLVNAETHLLPYQDIVGVLNARIRDLICDCVFAETRQKLYNPL